MSSSVTYSSEFYNRILKIPPHLLGIANESVANPRLKSKMCISVLTQKPYVLGGFEKPQK